MLRIRCNFSLMPQTYRDTVTMPAVLYRMMMAISRVYKLSSAPRNQNWMSAKTWIQLILGLLQSQKPKNCFNSTLVLILLVLLADQVWTVSTITLPTHDGAWTGRYTLLTSSEDALRFCSLQYCHLPRSLFPRQQPYQKGYLCTARSSHTMR